MRTRYRSKKKFIFLLKKQRKKSSKKQQNYKMFKLRTRQKFLNFYAYVKRLKFKKWKQKLKKSICIKSWREESKRRKKWERKRNLLRVNWNRWMFMLQTLNESNRVMSINVQVKVIELMICSLKFSEILSSRSSREYFSTAVKVNILYSEYFSSMSTIERICWDVKLYVFMFDLSL